MVADKINLGTLACDPTQTRTNVCDPFYPTLANPSSHFVEIFLQIFHINTTY